MLCSSFCLQLTREIISAEPLDSGTLPTPQQMTSHESSKKWRKVKVVQLRPLHSTERREGESPTLSYC